MATRRCVKWSKPVKAKARAKKKPPQVRIATTAKMPTKAEVAQQRKEKAAAKRDPKPPTKAEVAQQRKEKAAAKPKVMKAPGWVSKAKKALGPPSKKPTLKQAAAKRKSSKGPSFKEAFAAAREAGKKTFSWNGRSYNTKVK